MTDTEKVTGEGGKAQLPREIKHKESKSRPRSSIGDKNDRMNHTAYVEDRC